LQVYEETEIEMDRNPVDWGIEDDDDEEPSARHIHTELTKKGQPLYILSLSDSKTLRNGFRYIKELLLQQFNHFLNSSYNTLKQNNIEVYSVKTDAFTIKATDAEAAKSLILFNNNIGSWRISKTEKYYISNHEV